MASLNACLGRSDWCPSTASGLPHRRWETIEYGILWTCMVLYSMYWILWYSILLYSLVWYFMVCSPPPSVRNQFLLVWIASCSWHPDCSLSTALSTVLRTLLKLLLAPRLLRLLLLLALATCTVADAMSYYLLWHHSSTCYVRLLRLFLLLALATCPGQYSRIPVVNWVHRGRCHGTTVLTMADAMLLCYMPWHHFTSDILYIASIS